MEFVPSFWQFLLVECPNMFFYHFQKGEFIVLIGSSLTGNPKKQVSLARLMRFIHSQFSLSNASTYIYHTKKYLLNVVLQTHRLIARSTLISITYIRFPKTIACIVRLKSLANATVFQ